MAWLDMRRAGLFVRFVDWVMRRQRGGSAPSAPTAAGLYGYHPWVLFSFTMFGAGYFRWKSLPDRLKSLVHLRTAMRVGCPA